VGKEIAFYPGPSNIKLLERGAISRDKVVLEAYVRNVGA
jgi:hypothetical protein